MHFNLEASALLLFVATFAVLLPWSGGRLLVNGGDGGVLSQIDAVGHVTARKS